MPTLPNPGDKVRISYEGEVTKVDPLKNLVRVIRASGVSVIIRVGDGVTAEVIEPSYEDCGVYRDADGDFFRYDAETNSWQEFGTTSRLRFEIPRRPLTQMDATD